MIYEKTFRMPKLLLAATLAALRSGKYKQGKYRLEENGAYCCLGVMQMEADSKVERYADDDFATRALPMPSEQWEKEKGITDFGKDGQRYVLPSLDWPGRKYTASAAYANDEGVSFAEIADAFERHAEAY